MNLRLNGCRQFLDLVFAVNLGFSLSFLGKFLLLLFIDKSDGNWIVLSGFPECLSCFCAENFVVDIHLFVMVLQITVGHNVVVSLSWVLDGLASFSLLHSRLWTLLRRLEVMISLINV